MPLSQFKLFCSTDSRFWVKSQFKTCALIDSKMTLNTTRLNVPHIRFSSIPSPKFQSFLLLRFADFESVYFDKCAANDLNMILNAMRSKVPHISRSTTESQISICFSLQALLRQLHRMTAKWSWTLSLWGQRQPILLPWVTNFNLFSATARCFRATAHFGKNAPNNPQMTWNTARWKVLNMRFTSTPPLPTPYLALFHCTFSTFHFPFQQIPNFSFSHCPQC